MKTIGLPDPRTSRSASTVSARPPAATWLLPLLLFTLLSSGCAQTIRYAVSVPESSLPPARNRLPRHYERLELDRARLTLACKNFVMVEDKVSPIQVGRRDRNDTLYTLVPVFVGVEVMPGSSAIEVVPADFAIVTVAGDTLHPREYLGPGDPSITDYECVCMERFSQKGFCFDCLLRPEILRRSGGHPPSRTVRVDRSSCVVLLFERFPGMEFRLLAGGLRRDGGRLDVPTTRFVPGHWNEYNSVP